jgi:hypothetical protein
VCNFPFGSFFIAHHSDSHGYMQMYLKAREKKIKHIHVEQNLLLRYNRLHDSEIYQANASRDGMDGVGVDVGTYR